MKNIQKRNTLQSIERLKSRKQIEMLFQTGEAFSFFPLRVIYRLISVETLKEKGAPVRAGFSIPKKKFKKAVDRNRARRLLKEAWRLQKHVLYETVPANFELHCFLIFTGKEMLTFEQSMQVISKVLEKLTAWVDSSEKPIIHP